MIVEKLGTQTVIYLGGFCNKTSKLRPLYPFYFDSPL